MQKMVNGCLWRLRTWAHVRCFHRLCLITPMEGMLIVLLHFLFFHFPLVQQRIINVLVLLFELVQIMYTPVWLLYFLLLFLLLFMLLYSLLIYIFLSHFVAGLWSSVVMESTSFTQLWHWGTRALDLLKSLSGHLIHLSMYFLINALCSKLTYYCSEEFCL